MIVSRQNPVIITTVYTVPQQWHTYSFTNHLKNYFLVEQLCTEDYDILGLDTACTILSCYSLACLTDNAYCTTQLLPLIIHYLLLHMYLSYSMYFFFSYFMYQLSYTSHDMPCANYVPCTTIFLMLIQYVSFTFYVFQSNALPGHVKINITRDNLFEDSFQQVTLVLNRDENNCLTMIKYSFKYIIMFRIMTII